LDNFVDRVQWHKWQGSSDYFLVYLIGIHFKSRDSGVASSKGLDFLCSAYLTVFGCTVSMGRAEDTIHGMERQLPDRRI